MSKLTSISTDSVCIDVKNLVDASNISDQNVSIFLNIDMPKLSDEEHNELLVEISKLIEKKAQEKDVKEDIVKLFKKMFLPPQEGFLPENLPANEQHVKALNNDRIIASEEESAGWVDPWLEMEGNVASAFIAINVDVEGFVSSFCKGFGLSVEDSKEYGKIFRQIAINETVELGHLEELERLGLPIYGALEQATGLNVLELAEAAEAGDISALTLFYIISNWVAVHSSAKTAERLEKVSRKSSEIYWTATSGVNRKLSRDCE